MSRQSLQLRCGKRHRATELMHRDKYDRVTNLCEEMCRKLVTGGCKCRTGQVENDYSDASTNRDGKMFGRVAYDNLTTNRIL